MVEKGPGDEVVFRRAKRHFCEFGSLANVFALRVYHDHGPFIGSALDQPDDAAVFVFDGSN